MLGVAPIRGRQFTREDTLPGAEDVAVLSSELWRSAFGGDEAIVGRAVPIDGAPTRIVGIMPPGYDVHDERVQVWLPLTIDPGESRRPRRRISSTWSAVCGTASASRRRGSISNRCSRSGRSGTAGQSRAEPRSSHRLRFDGLQDDLVGGLRTALWVLQGAVGVRAAHRVRQPGEPDARARRVAAARVRDPLGARRRALAAAAAVPDRRHRPGARRRRARRGARLWRPAARCWRRIRRACRDRAKSRSTRSCCVFTLAHFAAHRSASSGCRRCCTCASMSSTARCKEAGQRSTASAARTWVRRGLVMSEVALAVVLVIGAGLLLRSFWNLMSVDAGFNRSRLMTFGLVLPNATYQTPQAVVDFFARLQSQLSAAAGRAGRRGHAGPAAAAAGQRQRHRLRELHAAARRTRSRTSTTTRG